MSSSAPTGSWTSVPKAATAVGASSSRAPPSRWRRHRSRTRGSSSPRSSVSTESAVPAPNFSEWEQNAGWWQEHFTDGADPEYEEQILPLVDVHLAGKRQVLDVGCGEGQLARRIAALGAAVVGIDPTVAQIVEAKARAGGPSYARAWATALPIRSESVDAVVACLVLEHIEPFEPAID